jgi:predicted flap endonuclease-1-like 5' DNA nuclease
MKNPPILISILGFFAALAGFGYLFFGIQVLGFDWFGALGDLPAFENVGLWGWLAVVTGIVWLLVAGGLWALQPWARVFGLVIAAFALLEAGLAFIQFPGTGVGFAMALMPALLLWYLNTAEVKAAFGEGVPSKATPGPVAAPAPVASPAPAAVAAPLAAAAAVAAEVAAPEPLAAPIIVAAEADAREAQTAHSMMIVDVEGIGAAYSATLASAGIRTTGDLLAAGARAHDRERIAEATGISSRLILEWVDIVDLMRVPGVGPQYSDLLEAAGVDSPAELALRNPAHLVITVQEVVAARPGIVRRVPTEPEIVGWIESAGKMEQVVEH